MPTQELSGTTALVTGASQGFGRAIAVALSKHGAHVAGIARDHGRLEDPRAQLGDTFTPVAADAADPVVAGQLLDNLFLPERETLAGLQPGCAQLTLHVDFVPRASAGTSGQTSARRPPYWRARFAQALALPGELAGWVENQLGLTTSSHPAAQSGVMLQARQSITEMVRAR
jgi:NAD(P)-dependent dehydrogenase (short-subunit alcohol dehydrogenase family)